MASSTRKSDIVARVGGDEFAILLDNISADKLGDKTAAMQRLLADLPVNIAGPVLKVNVSIGHYLIQSGSRAPDALAEADRSMYANKRARYAQGAG
jgi:diguanylate cyclase (GGDEF)-like protein